MSDGSNIQWVGATTGMKGATANPIRARGNEDGKQGWICTRVSPACTNCYASDMNQNRYYGTGHEYTVPNLEKVTPYLEPKVLQQVIGWRKPREIFWCSMTDLFGEWVPDAWIDQVFATIALTPHHRHIVLTKRVERAAEYLASDPRNRILHLLYSETPATLIDRVAGPRAVGKSMRETTLSLLDPWPLPNTIIGASVENQEWADKRRPAMERIAGLGWPTWVSNEPGLGPIDWTGWEFLRWMVSGGESGSRLKVRPYALEWARQSRDWCAANSIPWFFKQTGSRVMGRPEREPLLSRWIMADGSEWVPPVIGNHAVPPNAVGWVASHKGGELAGIPDDLRIRETVALL